MAPHKIPSLGLADWEWRQGTAANNAASCNESESLIFCDFTERITSAKKKQKQANSCQSIALYVDKHSFESLLIAH